MSEKIRETHSVCPVCLKKLPAEICRYDDEYFLEKICPEHGHYKTIVWRGVNPSYEQWSAGYKPPIDKIPPNCPDDCGLCGNHRQKTCCVLVEVTKRCNLNCPVCFAESGDGGGEPTVAELYEQFKRLVRDGNTFVQLSGGEPTVRDDLPQIVAAAKKAGCESIQLNSNGVRLAEDTGFVNALRDAGLSFVFMQFDGTDDEIYKALRGRPLLAEKKAAIKICSKALIGVTLVPTLVPGVNDDNIGKIISFGLSRSPSVRGVHFQPVSYFGRYPKAPENSDRITLAEVLHAIEGQTGGKFRIGDFNPSRCDHPYCGFHGDFAVLPNKMVMKITAKNREESCCDKGDEHIKNRIFVSRRWKRDAPSEKSCCGGGDMRDMDTFLARIKSHGFTLTAMAFQDAYNLDIERLRRCSLHVGKDNRLVPFCAEYLTAPC